MPLILMGICYTRMGIHLWGTRIIGEETETLRKNYQNKKKVSIPRQGGSKYVFDPPPFDQGLS